MTRKTTFLFYLAALFVAAMTSNAQDPPAAPGFGSREWTHADGRKIQGGIESAHGSEVTLRLNNGKTGTVKIDKLSADDQKYIKVWLANNTPPPGFGKADQVVEIVTPKGQMKYDKATFTVYPGKKVKLVLRNEDDMHHNLVICKPAKDKGMSVAVEAWKLGADGFAKHWIPKHDSILFANKMADPHSTATLYFTAPKRSGQYPYVCTIPGHAQVMNGTMVVSKEVNPLSELTFIHYKGSWDKLPDWSTIQPSGTDHVPGGLIDLGVTKDKQNFGLVFNAKIEAPEDGDYLFTIGSDDGSRLLIDGEVVIDNDGIHGHQNKSGKVKLTEGSHDLELQYFEKSGEESLYLGWKAPGMKKEQTLAKGGNKGGGKGSPTGMLLVAEDEARIYRNFIQGAGPRAIGVGYPGGLNLAYDANNMRIALLWLGDFIDAARHWNGRGQGFQPPAGDSVVSGPPGVPFAVLPDPETPWPDTHLRKDNARQPQDPAGYRFKGYSLYGDERIPIFQFTFAGRIFEQTPVPVKNGEAERTTFLNTFAISGAPVPDLHFRAAVADSIAANPDGSFQIGDDLLMRFLDSQKKLKPFVRDSNGKKELLVPITVGVFKQSITWQ